MANFFEFIHIFENFLTIFFKNLEILTKYCSSRIILVSKNFIKGFKAHTNYDWSHKFLQQNKIGKDFEEVY